MNSRQRKYIISLVKLHRAARRAAAIEAQQPQVLSKPFKTSKKDKSSRKQINNTVRRFDTE